MRKQLKKYVLVDEDLYERKFRTDTRSDRAKRYNPFTNPNITSAKDTRQEILDITNNNNNSDNNDNASLDINNASLLLQQLVQQYADNFAKATTKQRRSAKTTQPDKASDVARTDEDVQRAVDRAAGAIGAAVTQPTPAAVPGKRVRKRDPGTPFVTPATGAASSVSATRRPTEPRRLFTAAVEALPEITIEADPYVRSDKKAIPDDEVTRAVGGGHLNAEHNQRARYLLSQIREKNLLTEKFVSKGIKDGGLNMRGKEVKQAIRDLVVGSPAQRKTNNQTVRKLVNYLKGKGIKVDMK